MMWSLNEAIAWIQQNEPLAASVGWHLGLTGGVLFRNGSDKDLDVICYKHNEEINHVTPERLIEKLRLTTSMHINQHKDYPTSKNLYICWANSKRFDIFIMS